MFIFIIISIGAAILIYFSFFSKAEVPPDPEIIEDVPDDSVIEASVIKKGISETGIKRQNYMARIITFDCDDGKTRSFAVGRTLFDEIQVGERDALVYRENLFIGFGAHGAIQDAPDDSLDVISEAFTLDDYDENIDVEQMPDTSDNTTLSGEDRELYKLFTSRVKLPPRSEEITAECSAFRDYSGLRLLEKTSLYPFLKRESDVNRMFIRTYDEALSDLLGFDGDSRRGKAADSVYINKNEIRVSITLQENPDTPENTVTAEFGVNE